MRVNEAAVSPGHRSHPMAIIVCGSVFQARYWYLEGYEESVYSQLSKGIKNKYWPGPILKNIFSEQM